MIKHVNDTTKNILNFKESLAAIQKQFGSKRPDATLVLGSGLNQVIEQFEIIKSIPYSNIPFLPPSHVQGHSGMLHLGSLHGKTVLIFAGRFHHYQGIPNTIAALPAWISGFWGIPLLITTNASGGISKAYQPGDISIIRDHIFLQSDHPLLGVMLPEWENPFCDMTNTYDENIRNSVIETAKQNQIQVHQGVYLCLTGPTYETPAEIMAYEQIGADMVGMSTVPEVIVARKMGMKVLGISIVANMAAGVGGNQTITHSDVLHSVQLSQSNVAKLLSAWLKKPLTIS